MSETAWYQPVRVADDLAPDLVTGWIARTDQSHDLVPDGCVDVLWISDGNAWLCGPETTGWTFALPHGAEAVGVRRPGLARTTCPGRPHRRGRARTATGSVLESYARRWLSKSPEADPVADQVARLLGRDVTTSVAELATTTELSERQLHRRCLRAFGYGPATLRRILRLQRFIRLAKHPAAPRSLAVLAALAGYADQQHLARDCRSIVCTTPTGTGRPGAGRRRSVVADARVEVAVEHVHEQIREDEHDHQDHRDADDDGVLSAPMPGRSLVPCRGC